MRSLSALSALLCCVFAGGVASAETLVRRGQKAFETGKPDAAYAYTSAAIAHTDAKHLDVTHVREALTTYAHAWALHELQTLGTITDANAETALGTLAQLHALFDKDQIKDEQLDGALEYAAGLMLVRVRALATEGDFGHAEALMTAIAKAAPGHDEELGKLRDRAGQARIAESRAASGRPAVVFAHAAAAERFGVGGKDDLEAPAQAVAAATHTKREVTVTGACSGDEKQLDFSGGAGVTVTFDVVLGGCSTSGPTTSEGTEAVPYQQRVKQMVSKPKFGHKEVCTDYTFDYKTSSGATVDSHTHTACHTEWFEYDGPPEEHLILVPAVESVSVTTTSSHATGSAHVVATWAGGKIERDISAEGIAIGTHYAEPREASRPSDSGDGSVEAAQRELVKQLHDKLLDVDREVRVQLGEDLKRRAAGESDPLAAEDDLETAALISGAASPELVALVHDRYHMGPEELDAALFGKDIAILALAGTLKVPEVTSAEISEDESTYTAMYFDSATGRTAVTYTFDLGYAQTSAPGKDDKKSYLAGIDFYWGVPIPGHEFAVVGTFFDFRAGNHGLVEMRGGAGPGINFYGILINPLINIGVGKYGTPDKKVEPNLQYNVAFEADAALRLGFAIPHLAAFDATLARRARIGTHYAAENRIDLAVHVRPVVVMAQYTQLSDDSGDLFGGITLAHKAGQMLQVLIGFGL